MDVTGLAGLVVAIAVLAVATGFGLWRRRRDGRFRPVADRPAVAPPAVAPPAAVPPAAVPPPSDTYQLLTSLGFVPGTPVTLLQFSSAFCAPCRATRAICGRLAADQPGVQHLEVDAESHLDAVRALRVWRTPTVFVLAADARVVARVTGQPTRDQVTDAVTALLREEAVRS